jgi:glycosyltransferase involved in cell wall biosynthesis
MPEFFGESAWYYPPRNAIALADQLNKASSLTIEEKAMMKNHSIKRAADFTWEKCAASTIKLLLRTIS